MVIKRLLILSVVIPALFSCIEDGAGVEAEDTGKVGLDMSMMTRAQIESTQIYVFEGTGTNEGRYVYRIPGFTNSGNTFYMNARAGEWDMVMVNAEQSDLLNLIQPGSTPGTTMHNSKMWEIPDTTFSPSAPEIMTAHIENQQVIPNTTNYGSADLIRNVAMVQVVIDEAGGLAVGGGQGFNHRVSLRNVPTTLTWAGGLWPNKDTPRVHGISLSDQLTVMQDPQNPQNQISNTLSFIVLAHKGSDYGSPTPADTTKNKLLLSIDLMTTGGGRYMKNNVEIPVTPKMNKILLVKLSVKAQLTFETQILDWEDEYVDADIATQTSIEVSKTNIELAVGSETVYVNASADYTLTPSQGDEAWLSAVKLPGGQIEITATDAGWNDTPRDGYITVKANNLSKRIHVRQRAGTGTISVSTASFWVSPSSGNTSRSVTVTSTGPWTIISPSTTTVTFNNGSGGSGNTNVTFTRKSHTGNLQPAGYANYYGGTVFTIRNTQTLESVTVTAQNLYLEAPGQIDINGHEGDSYNDEIITIGGSGDYVINNITYNNTGTGWLEASIESDDRLKLHADSEPNEQVRWCTLTVAHDDDPSYTAQIRIEQNPYYDIIDPYSYLTGHFTWTPNNADGEIAVLIMDDNGKSILHTTPSSAGGTFLGCYGWGNRTYNSSTYDALRSFRGQGIARWGGDPGSTNVTIPGESFVVYVNAFDDYDVFPEDELTRYIHIYVYSWWYKGRNTSQNAQAHLSLGYWDGGQIVSTRSSSSRYTYVYGNPTGTNLNPDSAPKRVYPSVPPSNTDRTDASYSITNVLNNSNHANNGYAKIVRIRYDRLTHKTTAVWYTSTDNSNWPTSYSVLTPQ